MSEYNIQMNKYNALNAGYDQLYPQPMKHANTHAKDGSDPITPADIGAYTKGETDTLLANKRNWHGGHVSDTSVLEWAAAQSIPTECSCDLNTSGLPYSGYWMVQLSIYPEGGWRLLKATNVLNDDVYIIKQNGGIWDTEWTHIATATDLADRPKIAIGSYVGTGTYGENARNSLTFNFEPKIVLISCASENRIGLLDVVVCMRGAGFAYTHRNNTNYYIRLVWSGNTLSWYDGGSSAIYQLNESNVAYNYVALG